MTVEKSLQKAAEYFEGKKAFLFDMDGLIFDSERVFMEQLAVVMGERGYTLTKEIYCETLGVGGQRLVSIMQSHYGEEYPFREISHEAARRVNIVADTVGFGMKQEIPEVLEFLRGKNIPCAVASSTRSDMVRQYLVKAGLFPYFAHIIGGEMVNRSKPDPDIFLLACGKLGEETQDCVVLEDSENGVRAALRAGCEVICVPDLKEPSVEVVEQVAFLVQRS
ncbi:HAD family phosphatase [bacterium 1xD8-6]|jgi:haloacid dehalogenase superfamily, subfamily IA, variant 3 with third motif having DD or ED/haloacid dehalogenase superfamily, subfamily IA, variant 1 with third motif having Dx(3-4)D or Dx(3-4)E|nr:HAD family phosphatase [bacterium D16-36]RKI72971.1 HAD family phosphatase [bacterium 1xD8-6]